MKEAAKNLEFERAAALRDELFDLKSLLAEDEDPAQLFEFQAKAGKTLDIEIARHYRQLLREAAGATLAESKAAMGL